MIVTSGEEIGIYNDVGFLRSGEIACHFHTRSSGLYVVEVQRSAAQTTTLVTASLQQRGGMKILYTGSRDVHKFRWHYYSCNDCHHYEGAWGPCEGCFKDKAHRHAVTKVDGGTG